MGLVRSGAGLDRNGIVALFAVDQPMNRAIFTQYVRQYLAPELNHGDIVICDKRPVRALECSYRLHCQRPIFW